MYPPPAPPPPVLTDFVPKAFPIASITNGFPAVVTLTQNHDWQSGLYVRIDIPYPNSMSQLNGQISLVNILSPNSFSIPVNTTNYQPFTLGPQITVIPKPPAVPFLVYAQQAQAVPVAEPTITLQNAVDNIAA